jgi:hypothetical protein
VSNAPDLENYRKWSLDASITGGFIANGSLDMSTWHDGGGPTGDDPFVEGGITIGGGGGASVQAGMAYTLVKPIGNVKDLPWTVFIPPIF